MNYSYAPGLNKISQALCICSRNVKAHKIDAMAASTLRYTCTAVNTSKIRTFY